MVPIRMKSSGREGLAHWCLGVSSDNAGNWGAGERKCSKMVRSEHITRPVNYSSVPGTVLRYEDIEMYKTPCCL